MTTLILQIKDYISDLNKRLKEIKLLDLTCSNKKCGDKTLWEMDMENMNEVIRLIYSDFSSTFSTET